MSVTDNLLKTIDYAIDKRTGHLSHMDISGVIVSANSSGTYQVLINNVQYEIPNGCGISFKKGDMVWIHCPNGDFNKKFIISSRVSNSKSFKNSGSGQAGGGSTISADDIITDAEIDAMF